MKKYLKRTAAAVGSAALLVGTAGVAVADNIESDVAAGGSTSITLGDGSHHSDIDYWIHPTGSNGCDASPDTPVTITPVLPAGITADKTSLVFAACAAPQTIRYTAGGTGTFPISVTAPGGHNVSPAKIDLTVTRASNTAPTVTVTGVADGASYELGAVPTASCQVSDAEDGASTKAATLSSITGPLAEDGIGQQTATCSATDSGGLTASASATYSIVDTTRPALTVPADQVLEATGPSGAVATWSGPTATDLGTLAAGSPSCDAVSGATFALGVTTVTCTATDRAGNTATGSFTVTVQDTTDPVLTGGSGATVEATGPTTPVTYTKPTAHDTYSGVIEPVCDPDSGSGFTVGSTPVTCTATDGAGNTSSVGLTVTVTDSTGPALSLPDDQTREATSAEGASVSWSASASDLVDGARAVSCSAVSGSTFPLGATTVTCTSEDTRGNLASGAFTVTVQDTTAPDLTVPADRTVEATGPSGAEVSFLASATDLVDPDVTVSCIPASSSTFALGTTTVNCTAEDDHWNEDTGSFTVTVVDTTAPVLTVPPADVVVEATGPGGAVATFTATAGDLVDQDVSTTCSPASGSTFALGSTRVTCSATDDSGNTGSAWFDVKVVDTTAPSLSLPGDVTTTATSVSGRDVTWTATATDLVDGSLPVTCTPASGSTFAPGTTTVSCSATDTAGNTQEGSFTVTVSFGWNGFFAPVNNPGNDPLKPVVNTIKGGQAVPMKWNIPDGDGGWISSLDVVVRVRQSQVSCTAGAVLDEVEAVTSGSSGLRYDAVANQFVYNWQSPKGAGACYKVLVDLSDGSTRYALFKTK